MQALPWGRGSLQPAASGHLGLAPRPLASGFAPHRDGAPGLRHRVPFSQSGSQAAALGPHGNLTPSTTSLVSGSGRASLALAPACGSSAKPVPRAPPGPAGGTGCLSRLSAARPAWPSPKFPCSAPSPALQAEQEKAAEVHTGLGCWASQVHGVCGISWPEAGPVGTPPLGAAENEESPCHVTPAGCQPRQGTGWVYA